MSQAYEELSDPSQWVRWISVLTMCLICKQWKCWKCPFCTKIDGGEEASDCQWSGTRGGYFWLGSGLLCSSLYITLRWPVNDVCAVIVVRNRSCEAKYLGQLKMLLILLLSLKTKLKQLFWPLVGHPAKHNRLSSGSRSAVTWVLKYNFSVRNRLRNMLNWHYLSEP